MSGVLTPSVPAMHAARAARRGARPASLWTVRTSDTASGQNVQQGESAKLVVRVNAETTLTSLTAACLGDSSHHGDAKRSHPRDRGPTRRTAPVGDAGDPAALTRGVDWLDRAYTAHDVHLMYLPVDAKWDLYRSDPRYGALIARCGFTSKGPVNATGRP